MPKSSAVPKLCDGSCCFARSVNTSASSRAVFAAASTRSTPATPRERRSIAAASSRSASVICVPALRITPADRSISSAAFSSAPLRSRCSVTVPVSVSTLATCTLACSSAAAAAASAASASATCRCATSIMPSASSRSSLAPAVSPAASNASAFVSISLCWSARVTALVRNSFASARASVASCSASLTARDSVVCSIPSGVTCRCASSIESCRRRPARSSIAAASAISSSEVSNGSSRCAGSGAMWRNLLTPALPVTGRIPCTQHRACVGNTAAPIGRGEETRTPGLLLPKQAGAVSVRVALCCLMP